MELRGGFPKMAAFHSFPSSSRASILSETGKGACARAAEAGPPQRRGPRWISELAFRPETAQRGCREQEGDEKLRWTFGF